MHKTAWFTLFLHCIAKPLRLARRVEGLPSCTAGDALDAAGLALLSKVHRPCNIVGEQLVRTASEFAGMSGNRVAAEITWNGDRMRRYANSQCILTQPAQQDWPF
jgi:hypothetical protein